MISGAQTIAQAESIYQNGEYLAKNKDWHAAESPWKAQNILTILQKNKVSFESVVEVGCGAGQILTELKDAMPDKQFTGFDISQQASTLWKSQADNGVRYVLGDFLADRQAYDLLLLMDVFEHVSDYLGFLKELSSRARYFVFHIPLDMNMIMLAKDEHLALRERIGHLHYFSRSTAEATLQDAGYRVMDWFYTADCDLPGHERRINPLRKALFKINPDMTVKTLGGWSMMVLAESTDT
jgi:SAM-dependent methyltransferase